MSEKKSKVIQETLTVEIGGKKIVSNVFDFEAMCLIQDQHYGSGRNGSYNMCSNALPYLFESKLTEQELNDLPVTTKCAMCNKLWSIYTDALSTAIDESKNM